MLFPPALLPKEAAELPTWPGDWTAFLVQCAEVGPFLVLAAWFAVLRSSLLHSHAPRVLARARSSAQRARLEPLLAQADSLATSAGILEVACELAFTALLLRAIAADAPVDGRTILWTILVGAPAILLSTQALPTVIALRVGDRLLAWVLPAFHLVQVPLRWLVRALEGSSRVLMRILGLRQHPASARQIVEGLREVIVDSEISGDLGETERRIIGNVMQIRDANISAVMIPRTAIHGIEIGETLRAAARRMAECGHSRLPVYDGSLDTIVGVVTAHEVLEAAGERGMADHPLRGIVRPPTFVPETKRLSELLAEFRREKIKLAVVLDEYGGTAGLVTLGDIIREIVGDMPDEFTTPVRDPIRRLPDGRIEVDASVRVSQVNLELGAELPEDEGFETLAGFVLARLGRFPRRGETFTGGAFEYTILEASDRRVLRVVLRPVRTEAIA